MSDWIPPQVLDVLRVPAVEALALFVAALVVGKIADWILTGLLRGLARRSKTALDDQLILSLHRPVFLSAILFGLYLALNVVTPRAPYDWLAAGSIKTIALVVWVGALLRIGTIVIDWLTGIAGRTEWVNGRLLPLYDNVAKVLIIAVGIYGLLTIWQLDVTPWLASAGIVGIAVGLAAKDSLANLFGGISLIIDAPYKVGDWVNLNDGTRGRVTKIGLRSTRMLTRDDIEVTLPNSIIASSMIVNESGGPWLKSRIRIKVGVAYGSDVAQVEEILQGVADGEELVVREPAPRVRFRALGDSSLEFEVLCWIADPEQRGLVTHKLNAKIYDALNAAKVKIPFPQRELHFNAPLPPSA